MISRLESEAFPWSQSGGRHWSGPRSQCCYAFPLPGAGRQNAPIDWLTDWLAGLESVTLRLRQSDNKPARVSPGDFHPPAGPWVAEIVVLINYCWDQSARALSVSHCHLGQDVFNFTSEGVLPLSFIYPLNLFYLGGRESTIQVELRKILKQCCSIIVIMIIVCTNKSSPIV